MQIFVQVLQQSFEFLSTTTTGHPLNLPIVTLKASDADSGVNAQISYSIATGNDNGAFSLDSK